MIRRMLAFVLLVGTITTAAQQPFEGRIDYLLTSKDSSFRIFITSFFAPGKIYFETTVMKAPAMMNAKSEKILLDFNNGFIDRYHADEKRVQRQQLKGARANNDIPRLSRTGDTLSLVGHLTVAYATPEFSKEETKDSIMVRTGGKFIIYYAEDLLFPIPGSIKHVEMIPMFSNGHVALGSEISITAGDLKLLLITRVKEIRAGKLGTNVFRQPEGYTIDTED